MARIHTSTLLVFVGGLATVGCQQQPSSTYQSQPPAEQSATPGETPEMYGEEPMPEEEEMAETPEEAVEAAAATISEDGREFIDNAASSSMAEVELSRIALASAKTPAVREFAQKMIDDHTKINEELSTLAQGMDVSMPMTLTEQAQQNKDELGQLEGKKLEQKYIDMMVDDHQRAVELFRDQSESDEDPELQQFAAQHLPDLEEHLEHARHIDAGKTYRPPQASTSPSASGQPMPDEPGMMPPTSSRKP